MNVLQKTVQFVLLNTYVRLISANYLTLCWVIVKVQSLKWRHNPTINQVVHFFHRVTYFYCHEIDKK